MIASSITAWVNDPAVALAARLLLAALFLGGAVHKLRAVGVFAVTLERYRLLPRTLALPTAWLLVGAELLTAGALLASLSLAGWLALGLLGLYTGAISINLLRGRVDIDCGCSGPALRQTLSYWLVLRNALLALLTLPLLAGGSGRDLVWLDYLGVAALCLTAALVYQTANLLLITHRRLST